MLKREPQMSAMRRLILKGFASAALCCLFATHSVADAGHFDRLSLRVAGAYGVPEEGVFRDSLLVEVWGLWSLGPWWVLEAGGGEQWDQFERSDNSEDVTVDARYGWLGLRLVIPSESAFNVSAAVRRYRGRMLVNDDEQLRLGFDWGELGLHWWPDRSPVSISTTLREYWWSNNESHWAVTGQVLTQQRPVAFGLELESALDQSEFQVGGSVHYRF